MERRLIRKSYRISRRSIDFYFSIESTFIFNTLAKAISS